MRATVKFAPVLHIDVRSDTFVGWCRGYIVVIIAVTVFVRILRRVVNVA